MNNRSKEIIEDAISQGKWVWLEIDDNSDSLYLELENLKLSSRPILDNSYRGELAIRFGQNIYLALFFNEKENLDFLRFDENYLNQLVNSNEYLSLRYPYFYQEFSKKVKGFKFQNPDYLTEIEAKYKFKKVLADKRNENENNDFILSYECEEIAIEKGFKYMDDVLFGLLEQERNRQGV